MTQKPEPSNRLSIRRTMPVLVVAPLLFTILLTSCFAYFNSRHAVRELAARLSEKSSLAIRQRLRSQLSAPHVQLRAKSADFAVGANPRNLERLSSYFWDLLQQERAIATAAGTSEVAGVLGDTFIFFANNAGEFIGIQAQEEQYTLKVLTKETQPFREAYSLNAQGQPETEVIETVEYYPNQRAWYKVGKTLKAQQSSWSPVYIFASGIVGLTAVQPAYDRGEFLGVLGIDISLAEIQTFLQALEISEGAQIFVVERQTGTLIATSNEDDVLFEEAEGQRSPVNVLDLKNDYVQPIAAHLFEYYEEDWQNVDQEHYFTERINGSTAYVTIAPFQDGYGLDWLVVVSLPESDFSEVILASTKATVIVGGVIAIIGTVLGLLVARWIVRPIDDLNNAAEAIEAQRFQPVVLDATTQRLDELGQLARVFQRMGTVISANQSSLEEQKQALEVEVAQAKRQQQKNRKFTLENVQELLGRSRLVRQRASRFTTPTKANASAEPTKLSVEDLLYQVSYFAHLERVDIQDLLAMGRVVQLPEQTLIFAEDEPGDSFYIILAGAVDITVERLQKFLTHLAAGGFFGELSLLLGLPRTATVRTTEPTTVFCLEQEHLQILFDRDPSFAERVAQAVSAHQEELTARQALLMEQGLIENPEQLQRNPLGWVRQRLQQLFGQATPATDDVPTAQP
ncbi:MAG: cyclic nucleotide-binding domain-containing protein [Cyanobacteria bacterium P01_G01_bin.54]